MGTLALWREAAGCGKTGRALTVVRDALQTGGGAHTRYLVPTVPHKRSIEHLLLASSGCQGLFGDPVTTFFDFAKEVIARAGVPGRPLSDLQKSLLLKTLVRTTPLDYFARAARFPGFTQALGGAIDELKVHMVFSEHLLQAAEQARARGAQGFAAKLHELGTLYGAYQQRLIEDNLYDSEGLMWLAAEALRRQPALYTDLRYLVLDGFSRLTPIQIDFLRILTPRVSEQVIVLFDYEEGRSAAYHPVEDSLEALSRVIEQDRIPLVAAPAFSPRAPRTALDHLRAEVFRGRKITHPMDASLQLLVGATPAHEAELIARDVRALLRQGRLPDGRVVQEADIAILARDADRVRERLARTFPRFGLAVRPEPLPLSHTPVGRAMLAAFRLVREGWRREEVLALLKSGMLPIEPPAAYAIELIARRQYLRDRRSSWLQRWPDATTAAPLHAALAPLLAFDEAYHTPGTDALALTEAAEALLKAFHAQVRRPVPPLPDVAPAEAAHYVALEAAFASSERVFTEMRAFAALRGFRHEEALDILTTALLRETVPPPGSPDAGIAVLSAHATGGEKFAVVFLCGLLEGAFPLHQRESAFLMDHEREGVLRDLAIPIETRRHLEEDERYWFLHALSSATHRLVLSHAAHDAAGGALERSSFLDEVERILPALPAQARTTAFCEVVPPLTAAESDEEFLAALALGVRTAREASVGVEIAAAYSGYAAAHGSPAALGALFRRAREGPAQLTTPDALARIADRARPYAASELQQYLDCPFLWFSGVCLGVRPMQEEFDALDRGLILHGVLETLYRSRQQAEGEPVHLEEETVDALWPEVSADLHARLEAEPRFRNRPPFLKAIEREEFNRLLRRFLAREIARARARPAHPAYFERNFSCVLPGRQAGEPAIHLRGKIDRIDVADADRHLAVVIDYKTAMQNISVADLYRGRQLQAPIYALAAETALGLTALGVEFLGVKRGEVRGIYRDAVRELGETRRRTLDADGWREYLDACVSTMRLLITNQRAGRIAIAPTTKRCPQTCAYLAFCRGDSFTLAGLVREAGMREDEAALVLA